MGSTDVSLGVLLLAYIFYLLADRGLWNNSKCKKVKVVCVFNFHDYTIPIHGALPLAPAVGPLTPR